MNDAGDLSASDSADYWGLQGLRAVLDDNTSIYVQDDTPNNETQYRARFYLNPNSLTMATNDVLDLFTGRNSTNDVVRIQLQKTATSYQIRSGLLNDAGAWTDTSWYDISNNWTAIEIQYQAFAYSGSLTLWLDDIQKQLLCCKDRLNMVNERHETTRKPLCTGSQDRLPSDQTGVAEIFSRQKSTSF